MSTEHEHVSAAAGVVWQPEPGPNRGDRWRGIAQLITSLLLMAALLTIVAASLPVLVSLLEGPSPESARRGIERAVRLRQWASPERPQQRLFEPPNSARALVEALERLAEAEPAGRNIEGRSVVPRRPITLRAEAGVGAREVATVDHHTPLLVMADEGDWLELATRRKGRLIVGWGRRDWVVLLP